MKHQPPWDGRLSLWVCDRKGLPGQLLLPLTASVRRTGDLEKYIWQWMDCLCTSAKDQLVIDTYVPIFYSVSLVHLFVLLQTPYCLDHCSLELDF